MSMSTPNIPYVPSYNANKMTGGQFYDYLFSQPNVIDMRPKREQDSLSLKDYQKACETRLVLSMKESSVHTDASTTNTQACQPKDMTGCQFHDDLFSRDFIDMKTKK